MEQVKKDRALLRRLFKERGVKPNTVFVYVNRYKKSDSLKVILTRGSGLCYEDLNDYLQKNSEDRRGMENCPESYGMYKIYKKE